MGRDGGVARLLQRIIEKPHACAYLPDRQSSLEVRIMLDVTAGELDAMLERGWRRFGPCYFRPVCAPCGECVTLRVPVASFTPTRSQRRAGRRAARLRRVVSRPQVDRERMNLYQRWHASREAGRGWEPSPIDGERYALDFAFPHPCAREAAFYDDADGGRLVGVGLFDETPRSLSAAYFFYDPALRHESLGIANVLTLLDEARAGGQPHVYLGYRVLDCPSLHYKAGFSPHELLIGRPRDEETPAWRREGNP